jgi:hypothetical protein
VGLFPNFAKAREAWKAAAQATVDNAHMRYFVVHLHKILQPEFSTQELADLAANSRPMKLKSAKTPKKQEKLGSRQ